VFKTQAEINFFENIRFLFYPEAAGKQVETCRFVKKRVFMRLWGYL